ncbi:MAG: hypothetical protein GQ527_09550 [Bacteroidales bacterium]|nr:hypothetical protein [Bacteroidales bacterium]
MSLTMTNQKLQSLRIEAGWNTAYNQFTEQDPKQLNNKRSQENNLLMLCNSELGKMII